MRDEELKPAACQEIPYKLGAKPLAKDEG